MGQLSLSRTNRLNASMFWESCFNFDLKPYLSLKFYIFFNYFTNFFFYYNFFSYSNILNNYNNTKYNTVIFKEFTKLIDYKGILIDKNVFKKLKSYIYIIKGTYYVLFVYTNLDNYKSLKQDKKKNITPTITKKSLLYL